MKIEMEDKKMPIDFEVLLRQWNEIRIFETNLIVENNASWNQNYANF